MSSIVYITCPICLNIYDTEKNYPCILKECGHTFCKSCLGIADKFCSICKTRSTGTMKNWDFSSIVQALKEKLVWNQECIIHSLNLKRYCTNCSKFLCDNCSCEHTGNTGKEVE